MSKRILYHNIQHDYGREPLLSSVSVSLDRGKAVLLAGPNGSGKTTMMRIMAGLLAPNEGRIALDDHILSWRQARRQLLNRTVYLHQEPYMFDASVEKNMAFALKSKRSAASRKRVADAMDIARLTDRARQPAKSLSGGERRRLAIARAWLTGAEFMLLDEPTVNLDTTARADTVDLMQELHGAGVGLVLSCHTPEEISAFIDETVHLTSRHDKGQHDRKDQEARPNSYS